MHSAEFRRCLEQIDIAGIRNIWQHVSPHLPQPESDAEVLVTIHYARTQADSIPLRLRAYSHRWLCDQGYPSGLPDGLKPSAERIYPRTVEAVGISVNSSSELIRPAIPIIRGAMENAVLDAYADGRKEPGFVKARIAEARKRAVKQLIGR